MNNSKPKVSIIIPIYKTVKNLRNCLNCLINQSLDDIEIICIDSNLEKLTSKIIKTFQKTDKRILYYKLEKFEFVNIVNVILSMSSGEYISILDSQDYVNSDTYNTLYSIAKKNDIDIVKSDYTIVSNSSQKKQALKYVSVCKNNNYYEKLLHPKKDRDIFSSLPNLWAGIYKFELLQKIDVKNVNSFNLFYNNVGLWFQLLSLANSVFFVKKSYYFHKHEQKTKYTATLENFVFLRDEYSYIYNFLDANKSLKNIFINQYFEQKFLDYLKFYDNLVEQQKLAFLKILSLELSDDIAIKNIDIANFPNEWISDTALRIVDNYEMFYYEDTIYKLNKKLDDANHRLSIVKTSKENILGRKIANFIKRKINR